MLIISCRHWATSIALWFAYLHTHSEKRILSTCLGLFFGFWALGAWSLFYVYWSRNEPENHTFFLSFRVVWLSEDSGWARLSRGAQSSVRRKSQLLRPVPELCACATNGDGMRKDASSVAHPRMMDVRTTNLPPGYVRNESERARRGRYVSMSLWGC
jgi:hypothetical protein